MPLSCVAEVWPRGRHNPCEHNRVLLLFNTLGSTQVHNAHSPDSTKMYWSHSITTCMDGSAEVEVRSRCGLWGCGGDTQLNPRVTQSVKIGTM